jgi:hypothetical protein
MPKTPKLPRIAIQVSPELFAALEAFTQETGIARAQILAQMVSETVPVIQAMTEAFRQAKRSPSTAMDVMKDVVRDAHLKVAQVQLDLESKRPRRKLRLRPQS